MCWTRMTTDCGRSKRFVLRWLIGGVGMIALVTLLGSTNAEAVNVDLTIVAGPSGAVPLTLVGVTRGDGTFDYDGNHTVPGEWKADWKFNMDPDPHWTTFDGINFDFQGHGVFSFGTTNLGAANMDFSVSLRAQLARPVISADSTFGSVRGELISVDENSKLESHSNESPLYRSIVDGQVEQSLVDNMPTLTDAAGKVVFEEFQPRSLLHPGSTDFGIDLNYSLTPQAEANIHMGFFIVPEPTTFLLGMIGLLGLVACASKRRR